MSSVARPFCQAEEVAQASRSAEEDLSKSDAEHEQISLEEAYRSILAGTGLSAHALQTWLESWMRHVSAEVVDIAKGGIACLIPGSKAAELIVESRLGRAVIMIAGNARQTVLPSSIPHPLYHTYGFGLSDCVAWFIAGLLAQSPLRRFHFGQVSFVVYVALSNPLTSQVNHVMVMCTTVMCIMVKCVMVMARVSRSCSRSCVSWSGSWYVYHGHGHVSWSCVMVMKMLSA